MDSNSKEFLLKEYEQAESKAKDIYGARDTAIALYVTMYGAVLAAAVKAIDEARKNTATCTQQSHWIGWNVFGEALCLPGYFAAPAGLFLVLISMVLLGLLTRWYVATGKYITAANHVRRAFIDNDRMLRDYLVLPTGISPSDPRGVHAWIVICVNVMGGISASYLTAKLLSGSAPASMAWLWRWVPLLVFVGWLACWQWRFLRHCRRAERKLPA